jgi:uncharacterized damage-inducible protein DinB
MVGEPIPVSAKEHLRRYLMATHDAMRWKVEGLSEYDVRRPLTPSGTNLLGLVKHLASIELGYLGDCFGRPHGIEMPWMSDDSDPNADMWAAPDESRQDIMALYETARLHAEETIDQLELDAEGTVPWWPVDRRTVTLHLILVHVIAEANRHAGHADIVRELIDGSTGLHPDRPNLPDMASEAWETYRDRVERAAREASAR